jgi:hypothetical protein
VMNAEGEGQHLFVVCVEIQKPSECWAFLS